MSQIIRKGVKSLSKSGSAKLTDDVTLSEGSNITLTQTGNDIEIAASGGGGGISAVVDDTSPQLGGDLDANGHIIDMNGLADGIVLDADGDTSISADTDDKVNIEAGGIDVVQITPAQVYIEDAELTVGDNTGGSVTITNTGTITASGETLDLSSANGVFIDGGATGVQVDDLLTVTDIESPTTLTISTVSGNLNLNSGVQQVPKLNGVDAVGTSYTQTLTNKTISGASNTLSSIGNSSLTNSSVTIGSTSVSLGATATTLAGVTLTTPTIASFANANHNHTNSAGGGQLTDAALSSAVGVAKGGTGATSLTSGNVLVGAGTSAVTTTKAAPTGAFVGTTDTQTLTGKTIDGDDNTLQDIKLESLKATVAFRASRSTSETVGAAFEDLICNTEAYDYGSDYDNTTGVFTAPVAGIYHFEVHVYTEGATVVRGIISAVVTGSGASDGGRICDIEPTRQRRMSGTWEGYLPASGTIKFQVFTSVNTDINSVDTWVAGHLVGTA